MKSILDTINSPADLKRLSHPELTTLSGEIREFLLATIAETGGHLASNLGAVELTVALHYCFKSPQNHFIWDVGHQAYTHKILTNHHNLFHTQRQLGGLSGFPKRSESVHDAFGAGHASTSISAGLGIATARDLKGESFHVVTVTGDGALRICDDEAGTQPWLTTAQTERLAREQEQLAKEQALLRVEQLERELAARRDTSLD